LEVKAWVEREFIFFFFFFMVQWILQGFNSTIVVRGAHAGSSVHLKAGLKDKNRAGWCCLAGLQPALYGRLEGW
jgi:hypothetical protein